MATAKGPGAAVGVLFALLAMPVIAAEAAAGVVIGKALGKSELRDQVTNDHPIHRA